MLALTRWLLAEMRSPRSIAHPDFSPPCRSSSAARKRRYRERQRDGLRIYRLVIGDDAMTDTIEALIAYDRLTEADAGDPLKVEAAIAESIIDIGRNWRQHRDASRFK
jgi:hypothetical protein